MNFDLRGAKLELNFPQNKVSRGAKLEFEGGQMLAQTKFCAESDVNLRGAKAEFNSRQDRARVEFEAEFGRGEDVGKSFTWSTRTKDFASGANSALELHFRARP